MILNRNDPYHFLFYEESKEQIQAIEHLLFGLDQAPDKQASLNQIFRHAHSLKGACATLDLEDLVALTHGLEFLLEAIKVNPSLLDLHFDLCLKILDGLKTIHQNLFSDKSLFLMEDINFLLNQVRISMKKDINHQPIRPIKLPALKITFDPETTMICVKAYMVFDALKGQLVINKTLPKDYESAEDDDFQEGFFLEVEDQIPMDQILTILEDITDLKAIEWLEKEVQTPEKSQVATFVDHHLDIQSVKVDVDHIDKILNISEEFLMLKEALDQEVKKIKGLLSNPMESAVLVDIYEHLSDGILALRGLSIEMRLVPIGLLLNSMPRMVKNLVDTKDKSVALNIKGASEGIDKGLIDKLSDPLIHLVRNAVDHGIENHETRKEMNKALKGKLDIVVQSSQHELNITIADDGRGIDVDHILKKAIQTNLVSIEEAEFMTKEDCMALLFKPGFTTKEGLSKVSGRGVGLDVVQAAIHHLNGRIEIFSEINKGTEFQIKIPLTLSMMNLMVIKDQSYHYGIPASMIIEILRYSKDDFQERLYETDFDTLFSWREDHLPIMDLSKKNRRELFKKDKSYVYLMVLGIGERKMVLSCDKILGEKSLVIKPVDHLIGDKNLLGSRDDLLGLSMLGDGTMVQVVDVSYLLKK